MQSGMMNAGSSGQLDIGRRLIAFMYVALPPRVDPQALRHRLLFDVADPERRKGSPNDESALDGIMVPILRQRPLVLSPPFRDGVWLAGNGPSNDSVHRRSVIAINGHAYISQRFAIDWVMVGSNGDSFHDNRSRNENFWAFGQPAVAVQDGEITEAVDDIPDNTPGKLPVITVQNILGNHIILRIAPGVYAAYCHLKQGSIRVHLHQRVKKGEELALIGNSGNTTGPHLHFQLTDGNSALAAEGIPYVFEGFRFYGWGKDFEPGHQHPDEPRQQSLPADDSVVAFH
jgi:hypothetical protein